VGEWFAVPEAATSAPPLAGSHQPDRVRLASQGCPPELSELVTCPGSPDPGYIRASGHAEVIGSVDVQAVGEMRG